jgi:hypothetical protein
MAIKFGPSGKIVAKRFTMARLESALQDSCGFCLACGHKQGAVESDARKYECESCERKLVFGAEEIALMGYVKGGCE